MNAPEAAGAGIVGIIMICLTILGIILAIAWIFLPFLLLSRMKEILRELQKLNQEQPARHYELNQSVNRVVHNTALMVQPTASEPPSVG